MRTAAYGEDLAAIHAAGFMDLAAAAGRLLAKSLKARGFSGGVVVDAGCGPGGLATPLLDAGFDVLGVDASPAMIRAARRREPRGSFRVGRFERLRLPPCVAVAAVGECLSYVAAPRAQRNAARAILSRCRDALAPGGLLLFDVVESVRAPENREAWREDPRGRWAVCVRVRQRRGARLVERQIVGYRRVGRLFRRSAEAHVQRRLDRGALLRTLRSLAFRVRVVKGYEDVRFRSGQVGFVATKPD